MRVDRKYSILMSVYYKEKPEWLRYSIESMLAQTVKADEFLIVLDGPLTKELDCVIAEYTAKYGDLFTIVPLEKNVGLGPALAIGLSKCRNEWIVRMDSDDYSVPERCEKLLAVAAENPDYGIIGSFEVEFENDIKNEVAIHRVPETPEEIHTFMKRRCALLHPTVLYKKSVIEQCGNYHDVRLYEDYDLFMRVVIENNVMCYNIQENLYYIRVNDAFYARRGGLSYMKTAVAFKWKQYRRGYMRTRDFIVSAGSQAFVCVVPNSLRKFVYLKFLR